MQPIRPTGRELSIKNPDDTYPLRWRWRDTTPTTASETEKDALEWHLFAKTIEVMRLLEFICVVAFKYACGPSGIPAITTRLGIGSQYEGQLQKKGGSVWIVPAKGRHYVIERAILERFRYEVLKLKGALKQAAVSALAANPDLRDLLNLDPTCTKEAAFTLPDVRRLRVDAVREDAFPLDTRTPLVALNSEQQRLLLATHEAHHAVSRWRKDPVNVPAPPPGLVQQAHDAFEASALDEGQLHAFQVKPFSGAEHPAWTRAELGFWASVQDAYHHRWMDGFLHRSWAEVRENDSAHLWAHLAMNLGPDCFPFLFPCGNGPKIDACGKYTPREAMPVLAARLGIS